MNLKRILSSALAVVMVFSALVAIIPARVSAAHSSSVGSDVSLTQQEIQALVKESYKYNWSNAAEMLEYELGLGYLDYVSSAENKYTIYVNRYTGVLYYVNNVTGEILTSNPYNPFYSDGLAEKTRMELMSQVSVRFFDTSNESSITIYDSAKWAAEYAQIKVSAISNGLRVSYTLGDTTARFLLPGEIRAERFDEYILIPMLTYYAELLEKYCREGDPNTQFDLFLEDTYAGSDIYTEYGYVDQYTVRKYLDRTEAVFLKVLDRSSDEFDAIDEVFANIQSFLTKYNVVSEKTFKNADGKEETAMVYRCQAKSTADKNKASRIIRLYCPDYTMQKMMADEIDVGYQSVVEQKPVFRCSIEYTFNSDGSLSVRLPANSITFDETAYTLEYINVLMFFGAGDLSDDGYVFIPDGSGAIVEFEDFYNDNSKYSFTMPINIYGEDFCYSLIEASNAHREQITMPVYGVVSRTDATPYTKSLTGEDRVDTGYFAIIEDGASLANMQLHFGGGDYKFGNAYASFKPFPSDKFEFTSAVSTGSSNSYTIVSDSKYTGSYVTRYVMLSDDDEAVAKALGDTYVPASYTGMAAYYRAYLKDKGVLTALEEVEENLPLYIEALGSMEIVKKILTFPVTVSIPLTTFEDVTVMYDELASAKEKLLEKAAEYDALADAELEDMSLKENYIEKADRYRELSEQVYNITNVNFKLTGFANGGMYYTYPVKVKWESACGGKSGFENLLEDIASRNQQGKNFNVYPEFDFQYINNTSLFDGISNKNTVSKMVDNRYASKQAYDSVIAEYSSVFAMVISPDSLDRLYTKFMKKYSDYGINNISVSTLGSDLNSNFDDENPINRDEAESYIVELLDKMVNENNMSVMLSEGNIYSVKYAEHIIDISIDSSHFRYSSYSIPFTGLILHGYVNYAGSALNYSGSPDYDLLHAIENGASLYYLLCYENTEYMKEDLLLNKYYGVSYENWYDKVVEYYAILNHAIGDLQQYNIVAHKTIIAERVIEDSESAANLELLRAELVGLVKSQLEDRINDAYDAMFGDSQSEGRGVKVTVDTDSLILQAMEILNLTEEELLATDFDEELAKIKEKYENEYAGTSNDPYLVEFATVEYSTQYNYITDSFAEDKNYNHTDYTVDNNLVTMVTYQHPETGDTVVFLINYNIYSVTVNIDSEHSYTLGKYGFMRIDEGGTN